ncbi:hypothetical protein DQ04_04221050 [Trypanosoma grayi]|uniref:hypothetical protein n=1 Tax=Trypanosoma grayi TaxID=71804 RepID=UPI0004F40B90|nr:hypothetical protein DQ04_04221050 [Trypanosoma grayi]KEG10073.1 hypothetical protein DQ04_04221050 [Trypanosoma grayi]
MSDSESIVFHEQSETESARGSALPKAAAHLHTATATPAAFDRPPLHHAARRTSVTKPSSSQVPGRQHASYGGDADHDDAGSDHSESIQFHTEGASRNMSICSLPRLPNFNNSHTAAQPGAHGRVSRTSSRGHLDARKSEVGDESIQFNFEASNNSLYPKQILQSDVSHNESITFQVMEESSADDAAAHKAAAASGDAGQSLSPGAKSSASTIVFETEGDTEDQNTKPAPRIEAKETSEQPLSKKTVVSNRLSRTSSNLSRSGVGAASVRVDSSKKNQSAPTSGTPEVLLASANDTGNIPSTSQRGRTTAAKTKSDSAKPPRNKAVPQPVVEQVSGDDSIVELGTTTALPKSSGSGGTSDERCVATMAPSEDSPLTPEKVVPLPYPHTADVVPPPSSTMTLSEGILQARLYTEHWRLFNDIQREEIARLIQRIMEARRADSLPVSFDTASRQRTDAADAVSDFAGMRRPRGRRQIERDVSARPASPFSTAAYSRKRQMSIEKQQQRHQPLQRSPPVSGRARVAHGSGADSPRSPSSARRRSPSRLCSLRESPPAERSGRFVRTLDGPTCVAAAKLAASLGVAWPPHEKDALFFLTGARLTPEQRDEFYEAMALHTAAAAKLQKDMQSACSALSGKRRPAVRKKPLTTRTSILRKAFSLLDVDQQGIIHAVDLPAMRRLLEAERQRLAELVSGAAPSMVTVLSRARGEQRKLKGAIDVKRAPVKSERTPTPAAAAAAEVLLYAFVLDVIIPLLSSSGLVMFDFTTVGLLVFGSIGSAEKGANASLATWRQAALQYFEKLA